MVSNFWFCVKTYLKFEQCCRSCGVPLSPWGLSQEASRHVAPVHEAPFIFLSDMLSVIVQRGFILIVWTDHSRESRFDFGCWQNRHRLAELLWYLSCQFWHLAVLIVIGCLPQSALRPKIALPFIVAFVQGEVRPLERAMMKRWLVIRKLISIQSNHTCWSIFIEYSVGNKLCSKIHDKEASDL